VGGHRQLHQHLGALGSFAAGLAAIVAVVYAWFTLKDARRQLKASLEARVDQALLQLDVQFLSILPMLTEIEDAVTYATKYAESLKSCVSDKLLTQAQLNTINVLMRHCTLNSCSGLATACFPKAIS
jgi:hypothetical protein